MTAAEMALYFTAGLLLGGLYLGGLWLTVTRLRRTEKPMALLAASGLLRIVLLLGAFALVSGLEWKRLVACTVGFTVARLVATAWPRAAAAQRDSLS